LICWTSTKQLVALTSTELSVRTSYAVLFRHVLPMCLATAMLI